jgi:hypothetical protein
MALPKFDDWKRPWKDEEFDAEKAAKLIYNLHVDKEKLSEARDTAITERDELKTKVTEFEDKDLSEVERLRKQVERLTENPPAPKAKGKDETSDLRAERAEIALEKGLTLAQAKRLVGSTADELRADADAYIEEHNLGSKEGQAPPSNRAKVTTGSKQRKDENPDPDEDLDPGKLWDKVHA